MKRRSIQKLLALVLALTMLCGLTVPAAAAGRSGTDILFEETDSSAVTAELPLRQLEDGSGESGHQAGDTVRVSILLEEKPALERYSLQAVTGSSAAVQSYRSQLEQRQDQVAAAISRQALNGSRLAVSDAGVGIQGIRSALLGAVMSVYINTKMMKDRGYAETVNSQAELLIRKGTERADRIYEIVLKAVRG